MPIKRQCLAVESSETESPLDWLRTFERSRGRRLRVLHIGNIANNAYNNAKIQRSHGIEADVLCYDYYHVMGTPEWEDSDVGAEVDSFFPDWWATKLRGFRRPDWFVQGPKLLCIGYMVANARGQKRLAKLRRWGLESAYWTLLQDKALLAGKPRTISEPWKFRLSRYIAVASLRASPRQLIGRHLALMRNSIYPLKYLVIRFLTRLDPWKTIRQRFSPLRSSLRDRLIIPLLVGATAQPAAYRGSNIFLAAWHWMRRHGLKANFNRSEVTRRNSEQAIVALLSTSRVARSILFLAFNAILEVSIYLLLFPVRLIFPAETEPSSHELKLRADELIARFREQETEVPQNVWDEFYSYLTGSVLPFNPILSRYDIVQGYSIDGIIPLSNGFSAYATYEHGTLRDIPFERTWIGLVCRLAYRHAPISFITNSDVIPSVHRLGLDEAKVRFLPHAFDETKLLRFRADHPELKAADGSIKFFCPSRHHWNSGEPSWRKGNDVLLRGVALVASKTRKFRLTLVEWGAEVELSKKLINELGIADLIEWVRPMGKRDLWISYCTSHAVIDQFVLPAIGGVGFEAMALGRRLISRIDEEQLSKFFGKSPPVMNASFPAGVAAALASVIEDPEDKAGIGLAGSSWIQEYHSANRIVGIQLDAYRTLFEEVNVKAAR